MLLTKAFFLYIVACMSDSKISAPSLCFSSFFLYALLGYFLPSLVDMVADPEWQGLSHHNARYHDENQGGALVYKLYVSWV